MNKTEYKIHAEDLINDISNRIDELQQRGYGKENRFQSEFDEKLKHLKELRNELRAQLEEFDSIPESRWEEAKEKFKNGIDFLKQGFSKLFSLLSQ